MLGHKLAQVLSESMQVYVTTRRPLQFPLDARVISGIDIEDESLIKGVIKSTEADVVINAVGIVKQLPDSADIVKSLKVNSIFPHLLSRICIGEGKRFITVSTDCVFKGDRGNYKEEDEPDAQDVYGISKRLGEVAAEGCLTIRTSIIGREISSSKGLIEWFLRQKGGRIKGYKKAIFSGFPTITFSKIIKWLIEEYPELSGLFHISSQPISKYHLLCMLKDKLNLDVEIEPCEAIQVDRSLNSTKFCRLTGFNPKSWDEMLDEMVEDFKRYEGLSL